jgi:DNA-binding MarR family transcriptional regulator
MRSLQSALNMAAPADTELAHAWSETLRRHARVSCALERELQAAHGLGASEFEVLEWLAQHGKQDCRMQELSEGVHLSQSALSRLVGRLEADGLVVRKTCQMDRRGIYACITPDGRARYEAARPTQRAVLAATWDG